MADQELIMEPGKLKLNKEVDTYNLVTQLKQGVSTLMTSENYKNYLDFCSSLYNYSHNNQLLIYFQKPNSTHVGSFTFWKSHKRYVNRGEKGIYILGPVTKKEKELVKVEGTKEVEKEVLKIVAFKPQFVFDISQTNGKPIPQILKQLSGNSPESKILISGIKNVCKIPILEDTKKEISKANGAFFPEEKKILYSPDLSQDQLAKTLIHEYTHSKLHSEIKDYAINRGKYEVEAESAAYMVCKHFGLDTSDYSFGYISSWANGKDIKAYEESLKLSSDISKKIINELNGHFENLLVKEKSIIKEELEKYHYKANDNLVENIHQLYKKTDSQSLKDIKNLLQSPKNLNEEIKSLLSNVTKELRFQEAKAISLQR